MIFFRYMLLWFLAKQGKSFDVTGGIHVSKHRQVTPGYSKKQPKAGFMTGTHYSLIKK